MSQPASAAAAAAAGEEEEEDAAWADALDFDDSGFLRRGPASSPSRLRPPRPDDPAPAASLSQGAARGLRSPPHLASSGPAVRGHATDPDFSLAPWLHALGSLGEGGVEAVTGSDIPCLVLRFRLLIVAWVCRRGARVEAAGDRGHPWRPGIVSSTSGACGVWTSPGSTCFASFVRVFADGLISLGAFGCDQVVGVVTSCAPNRLGDLFLSLKVSEHKASWHDYVCTVE